MGNEKTGEKVKLKMSNKKFRALLIVPLALIALAAIAFTVAGTVMTSTLDTYLGKGETVIEAPAETQGWDTTYYDTNLTVEGDE